MTPGADYHEIALGNKSINVYYLIQTTGSEIKRRAASQLDGEPLERLSSTREKSLKTGLHGNYGNKKTPQVGNIA